MSKNNGFIALTSIIVISAVVSSIALSIAVLGIQEASTSLALKKGNETFVIAQSCIEESLLRLKRDSDYSGGLLNVGSGSCTINIAGTNPDWTITSTAIITGHPGSTKRIRTTVKKYGDDINLLSWEEIN